MIKEMLCSLGKFTSENIIYELSEGRYSILINDVSLNQNYAELLCKSKTIIPALLSYARGKGYKVSVSVESVEKKSDGGIEVALATIGEPIHGEWEHS